MRAVVLCLLALAACTESPEPSGPGVTSRVGTFEVPIGGRIRIDLLFVIDSSTAMAPYRASLVAKLPRFADALMDVPTGVPDVNIAVTTADLGASGTLRTSSRVDGTYLIDGMRDGVRVQNYTGDLGSVIAELGDVGAASAAPVQPLDVVPLALDQPGFLRDESYLAIVVIAATDDASTVAVQDIAAQLKNIKADPLNVILFGVYLKPASRLDAFLSQFPNRSFFTPIDAEDPSAGFASIITLQRTVLGVSCFEWSPLDVDPVTPGEQYDCAIEERDFATGETALLPRCGAGVFPCWDLRTAPQICTAGGLRFEVQRGDLGLPYDGALLRGQCLVE